MLKTATILTFAVILSSCTKMKDLPQTCSPGVLPAGYEITPTDFISQPKLGSADIIISKFSPGNGKRIWSRLMGTSQEESTPGVSVNGGKILYEGTFNMGKGASYQTLGLLNGDSTTGWFQFIAPPSGGTSQASIYTDGTYVYMSGTTYGAFEGNTYSGNGDVFVAKYGVDGDKKYIKQRGLGGGGGLVKIIADSSQNAYFGYITNGNLDGWTGEQNVVLDSRDSFGTLRWSYLYQSTKTDYIQGIAIDSNNNVITTGYTFGDFDGTTNTSGNETAWISKISSAGVVAWTKLPYPSLQSRGQGLFVDSSNNIYLSFSTKEPTSGYDASQVWKLDSSGNVTWTSGYLYGDLKSIYVDSSGNIFASGTHGTSGCDTNGIISKISTTTGKEVWKNIYGTPENDYGSDIGYDSTDGNLVTSATVYVPKSSTIGSTREGLNP